MIEKQIQKPTISRKRILIGCGGLLAIALLLVIIVSICQIRYPDPASTVIYEVTGSATRVDITLNNATGGTEQFSNVRVPVRYTCRSFSSWFLYISAQNQGEYGTVTVSIFVKDKLFKTSTSSGAYVIATASGSR